MVSTAFGLTFWGFLIFYGAALYVVTPNARTVGAFVAGVASSSVHGWLWMASALPGIWLGIRLRPQFGLTEEC
jgi:hypothetical protein